MNILVLYATVEGQTGKIAEFVSRHIETLGHTVILTDAAAPVAGSFEGIDAVILAAPVHQRRHPRQFEALLAASKNELDARKTLLMSVSLSAAFPEGLDEAKDYVEEMKMRTDVAPDAELLVAGAVKTSEYDFFAMQVVRYVVLRGRDYDPDAGEHEFTDWNAISAAVDRFLDESAGGDT